MRKIFIISFLLFSFLFLFMEKALAEEPTPQSALGVAPAIIEVVLEPGKTKETTVSVFNITNFPLPVKGNIRAFLNEDPLLNPEQTAKETFDASSWFKLEPADFILQPREKRDIKIIIVTPKKAEPGGHYATIYFQPLLPVEVLSPQTAYLTARIGVLVFLIVKGDLNEQASLGNLQTASFRQFGPVDFKIPFKNEGNIHLMPSGEIVMSNFRGREVAKLSISPATVLPKTTKDLEANWNKKYLFGRFTAQAKILYGSENKKLESEPVKLWIVPWVPLSLIIGLLTLFVTFFILVRRRIFLAIKVLLGKAEVWELKKLKLKQNNRKEVKKIKFKNHKIILPVVGLLIFSLGLFFYPVGGVSAAVLSGGNVSLSDSRPSETSVNYTFTWTNVTNTNIKCIQVEFATTAAGGTPPTGMVTSGVSNGGGTYVSGLSGWAAASPQAGTVKLSDATGGSGVNGTVIFGGITNGSTDDTGYYAIFNTYSAEACSGLVDEGVITFIYTSGQAVSLTVDPSISFTITGVDASETVNGATTTVATVTDADTIPLGTVTASTNAIAAHLLTVGTNAASGYTVYTRYTAAPTFNTETIDDHTGTNLIPTTFPQSTSDEDFGYTTDDATLSDVGNGVDRFTVSAGNKWAGFTDSNAEVAYSDGPVSSEETKIGYQVGVASSTPAGTYETTVILTCTPQY
jgi:hypothetical protein